MQVVGLRYGDEANRLAREVGHTIASLHDRMRRPTALATRALAVSLWGAQMAAVASALAEKYRATLAQANVVLGGVSDGVTVQDGTGRLLYANDAAARICGFADARVMLETPPSEIMRRFEVLDERGAPVDASRLPARRALAGQSPEPMLLQVKHHGTGRAWWSLVRASAIKNEDGVPELAVNIWHDVTLSQRQREAARLLAAATSRLAASLDYAETLKAVANALVPELADWCIVDLVEDRVRKALAVAHSDPAKVAMAAEYRAKYPPNENAKTGVPNVLRTGKPELYPELSDELVRSAARDEDHYRVLRELRSVMIVPITVRGAPEGAITLISSMPDRRFDERDLELAEEIGRRAGTAIENARAYRAAREAVRARDAFLAIAGHELRTPLAALMLQVESLKSLGPDTLARDPARVAARLEKTVGQTRRLARLIDGLLDITSLDERGLELVRTRVDLALVAREACARFADDAARASCELRVDADRPCVGVWDAARVERIVESLLSNAIKYGSGRPIDVRCARDADAAVLQVIDHGIGIASRDQERIFGRFERAVSDRNYGGLGLGLWIARELAIAHGGTIVVESEIGAGATFTLTLPHTPGNADG
ncbi:MAG: GAF domain-containing protein [Labilithrix sp.]|nr:GAF domain-containing protein [Labilithrix sp.]